MRRIESVFIVETVDMGWIIERLMREIAARLSELGIVNRTGTAAQYAGEQVLFNARYLTAFTDPRAEIGSLFITHVDDSIKELQLRASFKRFNSFVCMSAQDADFVAGLCGTRQGVVGIELPARDLRVRPTRLAIFSAHYEDGRKNEQWILDYFESKPRAVRDAFVFCFMGWGWEAFCKRLGDLDLNYEGYRYSRFAPGEYELYKQLLPTMDALVYLGFDGGAMSVYDALSAGLDIIASNTSYHRGLGETVYLFDDQAGFFAEMDRLARKNESRRAALEGRSVTAYVDRLVEHWSSLLNDSGCAAPAGGVPSDETAETVALFRSRYKRPSVTRVRSALIRSVQSWLLRRSGR